MEISKKQLVEMVPTYCDLCRALPRELGMLFPALQDFLSPAKAVPIKFNYYDDHTTLSITGEQRWRMLTSPHALTLMRAWAIQRQPANTSVEVDQENFIGPR